VLPYLDMLVTALRPEDELGTARILPSRLAWSNFTDLWSSVVRTGVVNSLEISGGATLVVLLVALPAAYYSARNSFRGRGLFLVLVLITQMFQPAAMLMGIYREFLSLNLLNSKTGLILVDSGFNLAFAVWILQAYLSTIPREVEEAGAVDGAGRLTILSRVVLPLAVPGIVTAVIFTFIAVWNEFLVALTLTTSPASQPLTVVLDSYIGQYSIDWGHLFAAAVIATLPVVVLFTFIQRRLVSGLTAGSVK
jgi:multiple sugar transport system permease protein